MTLSEGLTPEVADRRAPVRRFIDESIIPQEPVLDKGDERRPGSSGRSSRPDPEADGFRGGLGLRPVIAP